jgi:hypothetical protein
MKTLSFILTILLILPIGYQLFSAYELQLMESRFPTSHHGMDYSVLYELSYVLIDIIAIIVAIVLNAKEKYMVNTVMCATLLITFLLSVIINFADKFLFLWLK